MALGKRLIQTGGAAACLTETTDIFGDSTGKALYSMDFDSSETSGVYNGTPSNVDFGVGGKINTGARFNGSSSKIDLPAILPTNSTADSSVSFWFKYNGGQSGTGTLFSSFGGNSAQPGYHLGLEAAYTYGGVSYPDGSLFLTGYSMGTGSGVNGTTSYADGQWHHVVVTYDFSTGVLSCFVDNASSATLSIPFTSRPSTIGPFSQSGNIGYQLYGGPHRYAKCSIDQFRIFSKKLDSTEISTLNGETACVHTSTTDIVDFPSGTTNLAYYKLDNSAEDSKGTNDGTETSSVQYRFGRYGQAAVFNGADGCEIITTINNSVLPVTSAFSVSAWFRYDSVSGSTSPLGMIETGDFDGWAFFASTNQFQLAWNGAAPGFTTGSAYTIQVGIWFNAVFTYDGSGTSKMYINGSLQGTRTSTTINTTTAFLRMGDGDVWGTHNGAIDQVRIFASELSAANVLKLAEEKPETDTSNFKAVLWEGTDTSNYISSVGMDLETSGGLAWIKRTNSSEPHALYDSIRGINQQLSSDSTAAEATNSASFQGFTSFEANGFFVDNNGGTNRAPNSYVGWVWKGGGTAVSNGNGSITSSVSANVSAGFSIVSYTGTSTIGDTIGHGLGTPDLIIVKNRDNSSASWAVWSSTFSAASETLFIDATSPSNQYTNRFGNITATTFQAGSSGGTEVNANTNKFVAYVFKNVAGYQKIGSYSGSGSSGKQITDVGFKPNFLVVKRTDSAGGWRVQDVRRPGTSGTNKNVLEWNDSAAESSNYVDVSFDTNGFTLNTTNNDYNNSSGTYIYLAIK